jgi:hypothetical protein
MIRHGSSHGFAVLVCTISAALLIDIIKEKIPGFISSLDNFSERIVLLFDIPLHYGYVSTILFAAILAFIWGVFFKLRSH